MARRKRPPTRVELEQIIKAIPVGETKFIPKFDLTIHKQVKHPIGLLKDIGKPGKARIIRPKKK